ncbi:MAG: 5'/3'-nucleotidase SurE [Desulfobacterales bacterium]|nr:5'/3'-nucleotidase SurE [Desulfobacterales bacterium]MDD4072365.1 5'/3'-nucleotidase SurE [Desulfobacterales bacterium]MDD4393037.1 5'/3'-nucleotidase SurE [Desulfobacterales bacterium]
MKLILTNDDGIDAPGIAALASIMKEFGTLVVVAPDNAQSGVGHKVTTDAPIRIEQTAPGRYRVYGTPADCTRIALTHIAPDASWVIAGINNGGNLGADIYMSGTVAAVREATLLGYPAIAVSQYLARNREVDWRLTACRAMPILRTLIQDSLEPGHFWNINLPHPPGNSTCLQFEYCKLDTMPLDVRFEKDKNHMIYTGDYHKRPRQPGRDVDICFSGKITVTKMSLENSYGTLP